MPEPPRYHSPASLRGRIAPGELPCVIAAFAARGDPHPVGLAFAAGRIVPGAGRAETVWRLVVRGELIGGRFALRHGAFVELPEEA